ncbi:hypothetical protein ELUMI_v1c04840 [Williamsoniiplasma luminosum]|uniref:Uncharacterized protein n=1 Tax=Williamsoniiplasma luminosum TaxID=214888 RepID=A0A2K8NVK2_9MOLU|nr:hypothetical protein [Williamsoniiplasma luminosum]ATZ17208.1 hypothetical protein ELUMI_v1c04840 [Williamsoniiplasma luminosum]
MSNKLDSKLLELKTKYEIALENADAFLDNDWKVGEVLNFSFQNFINEINNLIQLSKDQEMGVN